MAKDYCAKGRAGDGKALNRLGSSLIELSIGPSPSSHDLAYVVYRHAAVLLWTRALVNYSVINTMFDDENIAA